jgi:anti-sigma B factor antagonist
MTKLQMDERPLNDKTVLVTLEGRLDATTAPEFKARLKELVAAGKTHLIVELSEVSFIDSSGLAAFVSGLKATREAGGTLKLVALSDQARTAFRVTLLDRVFDLHATVKEAAGSYTSEQYGKEGPDS